VADDPVLTAAARSTISLLRRGLATWFFDGQKPISVFATASHIKPDVYPKVEDDATIVLAYPKAEWSPPS